VPLLTAWRCGNNGFEGASLLKRMSPDRFLPARPIPRMLELGAMASVFSALASEAVCLTASRILAGRDHSDERQNHNDNFGHRRQLSVCENLGDLGKKAERNSGCRATSGAARVLSLDFIHQQRLLTSLAFRLCAGRRNRSGRTMREPSPTRRLGRPSTSTGRWSKNDRRD
jgi:hypothetical protein